MAKDKTTDKDKTIAVAKAAGDAIAREADETGTDRVDITITIAGEDITVDAPASVDSCHWRVPLLMQEGTNTSMAKAILLILGKDGCDQLDDAGAKFEDLNHFLDKWSEAIGMGE